MKVPLLFGFGVMIALRLVAMFARERLPSGSPLKIDGDTVQAHVGRGKYRRIDSLAVGFDAPHGWRFNLRREGWFDRFAKSIGLAAENFLNHPFKVRTELSSPVLAQQSVTSYYNAGGRITFSYRFGKVDKPAERRRKTISNDDVKGGIDKGDKEK